MKKCKKCEAEKSLDGFYKGHAICKLCYIEKVQIYRYKNIETISAYDRSRANLPHRVKAREQYAATPDGKAAVERARKAWNKRNPIKRMASTIVGNAVRDGKIIKTDSCESCKTKPNRLHGHHDDYAFPLVVRWLCPGCHNKWHKVNGQGLNSQ